MGSCESAARPATPGGEDTPLPLQSSGGSCREGSGAATLGTNRRMSAGRFGLTPDLRVLAGPKGSEAKAGVSSQRLQAGSMGWPEEGGGT